MKSLGIGRRTTTIGKEVSLLIEGRKGGKQSLMTGGKGATRAQSKSGSGADLSRGSKDLARGSKLEGTEKDGRQPRRRPFFGKQKEGEGKNRGDRGATSRRAKGA